MYQINYSMYQMKMNKTAHIILIMLNTNCIIIHNWTIEYSLRCFWRKRQHVWNSFSAAHSQFYHMTFKTQLQNQPYLVEGPLAMMFVIEVLLLSNIMNLSIHSLKQFIEYKHHEREHFSVVGHMYTKESHLQTHWILFPCCQIHPTQQLFHNSK